MRSSTITMPAFVEAQATGCGGASSYRRFAQNNGFNFVEVLNWCSSAGDWQFIISRDGKEWYILEQTNNYPRPGFSHAISAEVFYGTAEEVFKQIGELYY